MRTRKQITNIIANVYGRRYNLQPRTADAGPSPGTLSMPRRFRQNTGPILEYMRSHTFLTLAVIFVVIKLFLFTYYYNLLVDAEQNMLASYSNMSALVQRRNDIANNLSKAVRDYSHYEQAVFTSIVSLRTLINGNEGTQKNTLPEKNNDLPTGDTKAVAAAVNPTSALAAATTGGKDLFASISKLMAVAEQYPDLKLSANFSTLMTALVEVEKDLAGERIKFNSEANIYTTHIRKFPNNLFARLFNFNDFSYFEASEEAKKFRLIEY